MQIEKLNVFDNKCLKDVNIVFEIDRNHGSSTILIGENGTGKTTMLQTILEIMMSFDSDSIEKRIRYNYCIEYYYKGSKITIHQKDKRYSIEIDNIPYCTGSLDTIKLKLTAGNKSIFPERINYLYSGLNDHAFAGMRRVNQNYAKECRRGLAQYWNALYFANHIYESNFPKRKYNYCSESLVPAYLIALQCGNDSYGKEYLYEQCHISQVDLVSIIISVDKVSKRIQDSIEKVGLESVLDLISFIDDRFTEVFRKGFLYQDAEQFVFELRELAQIDADTVSFFDFFEKLTTIFEAEYGIRVKVGNIPVNCDDLSEGQRQLIKILGMLCICKDEDALVLMDEPDAHMNPKWKYELKQTIDNCLKRAVNTQAIIATHDPLVINGVPKEYIRVFEHDKNVFQKDGRYNTKVIVPSEDTEGLGIDGLLQSEYYGLKTSYDKKTTDMFIERQELYSKLINEEATEEEKDRLRGLTKKIGSLPVSSNSIDFLYDDFIRVFKNSELFAKEYLSYEEVLERRKKIAEVIKALYEE